VKCQKIVTIGTDVIKKINILFMKETARTFHIFQNLYLGDRFYKVRMLNVVKI